MICPERRIQNLSERVGKGQKNLDGKIDAISRPSPVMNLVVLYRFALAAHLQPHADWVCSVAIHVSHKKKTANRRLKVKGRCSPSVFLQNLFHFFDARNLFHQGSLNSGLQRDGGAGAAAAGTQQTKLDDPVHDVDQFHVPSVALDKGAQFIQYFLNLFFHRADSFPQASDLSKGHRHKAFPFRFRHRTGIRSGGKRRFFIRVFSIYLTEIGARWQSEGAGKGISFFPFAKHDKMMGEVVDGETDC
jgi:hypothetical protein